MPARSRLLVAVLALALALAGCFGDDRVEVTTERVTSGEVTETVSAPARVTAAARQDVVASVSGVVVALDAADGDEVAAGQVVVRLESSQVELAQAQAAAAQEAARTSGIAVDGGGAATRARAHEAIARLDAETQPHLASARARADAVADPDQQAAALAAVDAVEASYLTTRATLLATAEALAGAQDDTAASLSAALNDAVAQATAAQRAQADAAAAAAARQSEHLAAAAPFAGVVQLGSAAADGGGLTLPGGLGDSVGGALDGLGGLGSSGAPGGTLRVGAPVTAGQTLFTVYDLSTRYVTADVDEVDAPAVRAGQEATVLVDAFPEATFSGIVESVDVEAATTEAGGIGYPARVRITGPDGEALDGLRVGMTASAEIRTASGDAELVVPSRALVRRDEGPMLFVVRGGRAVTVPVDVELLGDERAAVRGAVAPGDRVVVTGFEELTDGDPVRVTTGDDG